MLWRRISIFTNPPKPKSISSVDVLQCVNTTTKQHVDMPLPQEQSQFEITLPQEVQLEIFSFLKPDDLDFASRVCKHWNVLIQHAHFWQDMFERDKVMWHTLEGGADWSYNNWRDRYLRQYHLNQTIQQRRQRVCLPSAPRNSAIRHFASKETKRNHPVPMFGASRLLFYPILQSEDPRIIRTEMFPGVQGVGSGVGLMVEEEELQLCVMYRPPHEKVFQSIWPIWQTFLHSAVGYVYVIKGGAHSLVNERSEILDIHSNAFTNPLAPLLIFVIADDTQTTSWRPAELVENLGLTALKSRKWLVQSLNTKTLAELDSGLAWLAHNKVNSS